MIATSPRLTAPITSTPTLLVFILSRERAVTRHAAHDAVTRDLTHARPTRP